MTWEAAAGIIGIGFLWLLNMTAFQLNDKEHSSIKAFLLMMSFFLAIPLLNFAREIVLNSGTTTAAGNMWGIMLGTGMFTVFIIFLYLFYYWFRTILYMFTKLRARRRAERGDVDD